MRVARNDVDRDRVLPPLAHFTPRAGLVLDVEDVDASQPYDALAHCGTLQAAPEVDLSGADEVAVFRQRVLRKLRRFRLLLLRGLRVLWRRLLRRRVNTFGDAARVLRVGRRIDERADERADPARKAGMAAQAEVRRGVGPRFSTTELLHVVVGGGVDYIDVARVVAGMSARNARAYTIPLASSMRSLAVVCLARPEAAWSCLTQRNTLESRT